LADLELCTDPETKSVLQNSVAVAITYNAGSPFNKRVDAQDPEAGLALRALHSYFIKDLPFRTFVDILSHLIPKIHLATAIECIMVHSNKGVLLLVDEVMKSGAAGKVVSIIGGCLDELTTKFNAVMTTLDTLAFQKEETDSGRKIKWVKLKPAKLSSAMSLFEDSAKSPILAQCIADCNGHFRSLETLYLLWIEVKAQPLTYPALIKRLRESMERKYGDILTIDLIKPALRGKEVSPSSMPDGLKTYQEYLSSGIYLNSVEGGSKFVPRLSPLLLMIFAERNTGPDADTNTPTYKCARVILSMLELEPNFGWQQYEKFHAHWEVLYRNLFSGENCTLSSFYGLEGEKLLANDPVITLSSKSTDLCELPNHFPPKDSTDVLPSDLECQVVVPYLDNPGFDLVYSEKRQGDAQPIVVCVECRFSIPNATTVLSLGEVETKHQLVYERFSVSLGEKSLCGLKLGKEDIYLVVCAFRKTFVVTAEKLPSNTIVLGREQLKRLYTPSLSSRPQFISSRAHGVADNRKK
jgi:hypothetical protein